VSDCSAQPGVKWVRMTTDLPAAFMAMAAGDLDLKSYLHSLKSCDVEAVFASDDPLPGIAEVLMVPYLAVKRGF
jgi:D-aspartate ligase